MSYSADCQSFTGKWRHGPSGDYNEPPAALGWNGTRIQAVETPTPPPTTPPTLRPSPTPPVVAIPTDASLVADRRSVPPGGTVSVPVRLERAESIGSTNFTLTYDTAVVSLNKVDVGDLVRGIALFRANTKDAGIIRFGVAVQSG